MTDDGHSEKTHASETGVSTNGAQIEWLKVLDPNELPEGRVKPVTCERTTVCMTLFEGQYGALDNKCPHQGGPLGEGSIENGLLRCPWHGWDYDPLTGFAPGYDDGVKTYPVEVRDDGIYVGFEIEPPHVRTVSDVMAETMVNWGIQWVFGMVGHSNLGMADALRIQEERRPGRPGRLGNIRTSNVTSVGQSADAVWAILSGCASTPSSVARLRAQHAPLRRNPLAARRGIIRTATRPGHQARPLPQVRLSPFSKACRLKVP